MRRFQICSVVMILTSLCLLCPVPNSYAAHKISYFHVQHRVYENGDKPNRLYVEIQDEKNNYVFDESFVTSISLTAPGGSEVDTTNLYYYSGDSLSVVYNTDTGQWTYGEWFSFDGHSADIMADLINGTYKLTVKTNDGQTLNSQYEFKGSIDLPYVQSSTFKFTFDSQYSLFWSWDIPTSFYYLDSNLSTSLRALIAISKDGQYAGDVSIKIPTHMNQVIIPLSLLQGLVERGNGFDFSLQIRTNDNNNRGYSNTLSIK